jgi:uncharacterized protein (DUF169 family)
MARYAATAQTLQTVLALALPPVALARVRSIPPGIPVFHGVSPSACGFWRHAEKGLFAAQGSDHMNCPVGAMTMGFELTPDAKEKLGGGLALMTEVGYIDPKEAEHLPALSPSNDPLLYGPLADFPLEPQLVLLWLTPRQAMLLREATGDVRWKSDVSSGLFGRPACAALPVAERDGNVALSFGCNGMRTFTGIDPSQMLAAVSGRLLPTLGADLERAHRAQGSMQQFYDQQHTFFPFTAKPVT